MLDMNIQNLPGNATSSFKEELVNLCDEFTEYNDYCAFFCDSVSLFAGKNDSITKESARGLQRYAQSLKNKTKSLQLWLQEIQSMS